MIKIIPGTKDILPPESALWQKMEQISRAHFALYHFDEIRTPILEETDLFVRSIGTETGVVKKEMYTFLDKGGDSVTMRPEGTASVVRSYIEHNLERVDPIAKLYYIGPMFRYERPQKGRQRQFHQAGCELIGSDSAEADIEIIVLLYDLINKLGVKNFELQINSLGCLENENCRPRYLKTITDYLTGQKENLCGECQRKLEINPLRILDCKNEACKALAFKAPIILDFLCGDCKPHFEQLTGGLNQLEVACKINPRIVRGLDYYNRTAFEVISNDLGSQNAFAGGGRYNKLIASMGGSDKPAIGFAIGLERLMLLLAGQNTIPNKKLVYMVCLGAGVKEKARQLTRTFRAAGVVCEMDYEEKSLKAQMRRADKLGASFVVMLGDNEIAKGVASVKNMVAKSQIEVPFDQLIEHLR